MSITRIYIIILYTNKKRYNREKTKYFISHIKVHFSLPKFLVERNAKADKLTMPIANKLPNIFKQAKLSHAFFHQNAQALMRTFRISKDQAKATMSACPNCLWRELKEPSQKSPRQEEHLK